MLSFRLNRPLRSQSCLAMATSRINPPSIAFSKKLLCNRWISTGAGSGLLGLPAFKSANDFTFMSNEVIKRCIALREEVSCETDPLRNLLLMDQISNEVCSVIDVAEYCRRAHDDAEYRCQAEVAFTALSNFIHSLNTDITLYGTLQNIVDTESIFSLLPEEHKIFATDLKSEFESGGIHLRGTQKEAAVALQGSVVASETKFIEETSQNRESSNFSIGPFTRINDHSKFSSWLGQYVKQPDSLPKLHVMCSSNRRISATVLRSLDEEPLRKIVWTSMYDEPSRNVENLGQLIKDRQALGKVLGYKSFAHKYLANKMLKTPDEVQTLLSDVAVTIRPKAQLQMESLLDLKRDSSGSSSAVLNPWDVSYYMNLAEAKRGQQLVNPISAVSDYFPLNRCIDGLVGITESIFGIKVRISDVSDAETWLRSTSPSTHNHMSSSGTVGAGYLTGALKCDFTDANGNAMGTAYLDLFNRPIKFPGAAHFSLRCGCNNSADNISSTTPSKSSLSSSSNTTNAANTVHGGGDGGYQLPIVALSFNFNPSQGSSLKPPLLTLLDIETLYHEWGHALHSILSRTTFQHLSGTRGPTDFVEVPSHLFEYFARTPSVITQWAKHHETGKPIPAGMLEEAFSMRKRYAAIEFQNQILFSAADQHVFGTDIGDVSDMTPSQIYEHSMRGIAQLQMKLTDLPLGALGGQHKGTGTGAGDDGRVGRPNMLMLSHSHFVNYGGGYYSYIFAKLHAAQIWHNVFEKDPMSRQGGLRLWHSMLKYGAARDTKLMLSDLGGGELRPEHCMNAL